MSAQNMSRLTIILFGNVWLGVIWFSHIFPHDSNQQICLLRLSEFNSFFNYVSSWA